MQFPHSPITLSSESGIAPEQRGEWPIKQTNNKEPDICKQHLGEHPVASCTWQWLLLMLFICSWEFGVCMPKSLFENKASSVLWLQSQGRRHLTQDLSVSKSIFTQSKTDAEVLEHAGHCNNSCGFNREQNPPNTKQWGSLNWSRMWRYRGSHISMGHLICEIEGPSKNESKEEGLGNVLGAYYTSREMGKVIIWTVLEGKRESASTCLEERIPDLRSEVCNRNAQKAQECLWGGS